MKKSSSPPPQFQLLCDLVSPFDHKVDLACLGQADWHHLIELADYTHVLPELYHGLNRSALFYRVPSEFQQLLAGVYELVLFRGKLVRAQCEEITRAMNEQGIVPVWLKGAALLFEPDWPQKARLMNDIDLWVPAPEQQITAMQVLDDLGYLSKQDHESWAESHHFAPFYHPKRVSTVELHKDVIRPALSALLPNRLCAQNIEYQQSEGLAFGILCLEHRIAQSFVQCSFMASPTIETGLIRLMKIVDLLRLLARAQTRALPEQLIASINANVAWQPIASQVTTLLGRHFDVSNPFAENHAYLDKLYTRLSSRPNTKTIARKLAITKRPVTPFNVLMANPKRIFKGIKARVNLLVSGKL